MISYNTDANLSLILSHHCIEPVCYIFREFTPEGLDSCFIFERSWVKLLVHGIATVTYIFVSVSCLSSQNLRLGPYWS
jgi:hypothetical protein